MKSLNLKLVSLYVFSVFVVVTAVFTVTEYVAFKKSETSATRLMEIGPGYLNGATLDAIEEQARSKGENIFALFSELTTGRTATNVIKDFRPVFNLTTPIGRSENTSITLLPELFRASDNYYLIEEASSEIGSVIISDNFFPSTISSFVDGPPWRRLYYTHVEGYDDLVIIGSLDIRFTSETDWIGKVFGDVLLVSPLVLVAALLLGSAITRITVSPVVRLTQYSEKLAAGNLIERTDFTSTDELGRLAHSLNRMASKLQEAFDSQKTFVSNAAHEMRTPLASMKTSVTGALSNSKMDEDHHRLLALLSRRIETQERLINDLLLQAQTDDASPMAEGRCVGIADIVKTVGSEFEPVFEDKGIKFQIEIDGSVGESRLFVTGDPRQLSRLFSNLLDNAAKNTPYGGTVKIEATSENNEVVIRVRDTGRGIAPEHIDKIFGRFYKVTEDRNPESGFGLGLSLCRSIVSRHGGVITVESSLGQGSTFTVRLSSCRE